MILQRSLTLRLTFFFSAATVLTLIILSLFLNNVIMTYFLSDDAHVLRNKAHLMKEVITRTHFDDNFINLMNKMEQLEGVVVKVDNPDDDIVLYISDKMHFPEKVINSEVSNVNDSVFSMPPTDFSNKPPAKMPIEESDFIEWQTEENYFRGMQFHFIMDDSLQTSVLITLALNINHHRGFLEHFRSASIKFVIIAGLLSGLFQWMATYHGLRPLKILSKKATLVSGKDIKQRMPVNDLPIEIAGLSETLNNMLERLEDAFERLENFSSDIAHELRTPINNLMMQTQVVLSKPRSKHEYLVALGSNYEEFEKLARMITDMLFLAKADNDQLLLVAEPMILQQEVANLFEFYEALAEDCEITLSFEGEAEVKGDKLMLRRALSNLISNAIHHSLKGSEILIRIDSDETNATLEVINTGPTIPPELIPHIFGRFYRADKARTSCAQERVGLGLAITRSIAKAHGGDISVTSKYKITNFKLTISKGN